VFAVAGAMTRDRLHGRSVFVTRAYGLLGGWLSNALVAQGARTTVLKRDSDVRSALEVEGTRRTWPWLD
jgi:CDP-glucose 4,6-dehydratase